MSKKKKSLDELLEEALVPDDEHWFEGSNNSIWVTTETIIEVRDGTHDSPKYVSEGIPLVTSKNLKNGEIDFSTAKFISIEDHEIISKRSAVNINDILFAMIGTIGNPVLIKEKEEFSIKNVALFKENNNVCLSKYFYYFIQSTFYQKYLELNEKGSTQKFIPLNVFRKAPLYLPSINEQHKIVSKIEILFSKIDEAQQLIKEAKETFELRRAAILDMAFRGGNIRNREELPNGWQYKKFNDVAKVKSNLVNPSEFLSYPHIAPDNIEKHTGRLLSYRTIEEDGVKSNKHYFEKGSILYSKIRPYLSKVVIVDFEGLCSADMYPIETELNVEYLYWYMLSPMFLEQATTAGSRSVLPKINQKELGEILVPVCSLDEQEKTVTNLNNLLQEEGSILKFIEQGEGDIERLKQSILSKAFKGELDTNNPTDEPAIELLKSILEEKL